MSRGPSRRAGPINRRNSLYKASVDLGQCRRNSIDDHVCGLRNRLIVAIAEDGIRRGEARINQDLTRMLGAKLAIDRVDLQEIFDALANRGYQVIGPTVRDGAIIYDTIARLEDLPVGWTDRQDAGRYRLEKRADAALFGYAVGPHSWKRFFHPPTERLWQARREGSAFTIVEAEAPHRPLALIGVRACELRAIAIHDSVFLAGAYVDKPY